MPELPEVEVTRRGFADAIAGARIVRAQLGLPLRWPLGIAPEALQGRRITGVRRRGKYLLLDMDQGLLMVHLGMSGRLSFSAQPPGPPGKHDHFDLQTSAGTLRLTDPRRFGAVIHADSQQAPLPARLLGKLGVEPLQDAFDARAFHQALGRRQASIKQVLLAGDVVVGVGNIYANEALFRAGIRPTTSAARLSWPRVQRLHRAIGEVLTQAIEMGGSTLRDFSNTDGASGYFQLQAMVYGRENLPCQACTTPVKMLRQGQRASFYCPKCQKP